VAYLGSNCDCAAQADLFAFLPSQSGSASLFYCGTVCVGWVLAALTGRLFMLDQDADALQFLDFHWDVVWSKYSRFYADAGKCDVDINKLIHPDLHLCSGNISSVIMVYSSLDYEVPLLQVNAAFTEKFRQLFPAGDVFHQVTRQLFSPAQVLLQEIQPYIPLSSSCIVGMHLRTKKHFHNVAAVTIAQQFATSARAIAQELPGTVFVAADADVFTEMSGLLPGRQVWWSNLTRNSINSSQSAAGNPGTDISAMVDLQLLSRCHNVLVTAGSSFGNMAAGIANVPPVYVIPGQHDNPSQSPWFWKALSSEPFFWKMGVGERHRLASSSIQAVQEQHPLYYQFVQGHP
jgi:hypothetical protein